MVHDSSSLPDIDEKLEAKKRRFGGAISS